MTPFSCPVKFFISIIRMSQEKSEAALRGSVPAWMRA
jgi:hypothetical protein